MAYNYKLLCLNEMNYRYNYIFQKLMGYCTGSVTNYFLVPFTSLSRTASPKKRTNIPFFLKMQKKHFNPTFNYHITNILVILYKKKVVCKQKV